MQRSLVLVRLRPWRFLAVDGKWTEFLWRAKKFDSSLKAAAVARDYNCMVFGDWQLPKYMALELKTQLREQERRMTEELDAQLVNTGMHVGVGVSPGTVST